MIILFHYYQLGFVIFLQSYFLLQLQEFLLFFVIFDDDIKNNVVVEKELEEKISQNINH
jgi:hypothetical protein